MRTILLVVACAALVPGAAAAFDVGHLASDAEFLALSPSPAIVAEGRIGDLGGAATFELDLGQETSLPAETRQYGWVSGQVEPFTFTYDAGLDQATFELGGEVMVYDVGGVWFNTLFLRTRAVDAGTAVTVDNLFYNGVAVGDQSSADGDLTGIDYLVIENADPDQGFVITGDATLSWTGSAPTQSRLAFEIKAVEVTGTVPNREGSLGALKASFGE
jgi:hypothetical protein